MKKLWVFTQAETIPSYGSFTRHFFLGQELAKFGWHTTMFCGSTGHNYIKYPSFWGLFSIENISPSLRVVWVRTNPYRRSHGIGRILSWGLFVINLILIIPFIKGKPHSIITHSFPFFPHLIAVLMRKTIPKTQKIIFEVSDLYPSSLVALADFSEKSTVVKCLTAFERWAYKSADHVVGTLPLVINRVKEVHPEFDETRYTWISNGIHPEYFEDSILPRSIEAKLNSLDKDSFKIGFAGTFNNANAIQYLIEVAKRASQERENWEFILMGDGPELDEVLSAETELGNVYRLPKVEKKQVAAFLQNCDCLYFGCRKSPLYEYGLIPLKLLDYLLSQKPIVMAGKYPPNIIRKTKGGIEVEAGDLDQIYDGIRHLSKIPNDQLAEMGRRNYMELLSGYTHPVLAKKYAEILNSGLR